MSCILFFLLLAFHKGQTACACCLAGGTAEIKHISSMILFQYEYLSTQLDIQFGNGFMPRDYF
jgi:hypothetical protein